MRGDNSGPHTPEEIAAIHAELAAQFPNAEITACQPLRYGQRTSALSRPASRRDPGDRRYLDLRLRKRPAEGGPLSRSFPPARRLDRPGQVSNWRCTDLALLRSLLLEAEHTWGTDTKTWIDFDNYKPADLARMLDTKGYKVMEFSWEEKRKDLYDAVATLPANLRSQALSAIQNLAHHQYEPKSLAQAIAQPAGKPIETAHFILEIDAQTGAITRLRNKATGREWASKSNPIALFTYQTLSQEDYHALHRQPIVT